MTGPVPKQYRCIGDRPILSHTVAAFDNCPAVNRIFLVVPEADFDRCRETVLTRPVPRKPVVLVPGGPERQASVYNGLVAADAAADEIVVIHDGVRPFVSCERLTACIAAARTHGACVLGIPVADTLKAVDSSGQIQRTVSRRHLWQAQTPQAFCYRWIRSAHEAAHASGYTATDDAMLLEWRGKKVHIIAGSVHNLKITTDGDLALADALLRGPGPLP